MLEVQVAAAAVAAEPLSVVRGVQAALFSVSTSKGLAL